MSKIKDWYNSLFSPQGNAAVLAKVEGEQKAFLRECLTNMNCEIEVNENDENVWYFNYQGGSFMAYFRGESQWLELYSYFEEVPLDDVDRLAAVRRAINDANCYVSPWCLLYTINPETRMMNVNMRLSGICHRSLPDAQALLRTYLDTAFLRIRQYEGALAAIENALSGGC